MIRHWSRFSLACTVLATSFAGPAGAPHAGLPAIAFNDNRLAAGTRSGGVLSVTMVAAPGNWRPFGVDRSGIPLSVFGEAGKPLQDPGPLLRVPLGTQIHVRVRNLTGAMLVVHGLAARRVPVMDTLVLAPGAAGEASFTADAEGTFYYWASTHGEDFEHRELDDAHLNGALIVDPAGTRRPRPDRVFVLERNTPDTTGDGLPDFAHNLFTINGRPWPYTERLSYDIGDSVRWRIINATNDVHPMHLHGFYYRVNARGDVTRDTIYWPSQQRMAVTEAVWDGTTMDMSWQPDRPGGWVFHCHFNAHVVPNTALVPDTEPTPQRLQHLLNGYPDQHAADHAMTAMGGLVLGITVRQPPSWQAYTGPRRTLRLLVQSDSTATDTTRQFGYVLQRGSTVPAADSVNFPGPPLVLHRGEPTRIWVVNRTPEMTQVHWHGLELESYYDGVAGLSGTAAGPAPPIMPGDSFEVLVTPPRAGTFIYHTHINDIRQQSHGLYGPLIVLDSAERWNPETDRIFILGSSPGKPVLNGGTAPPALTLTAGAVYRFRLINITVGTPGAQFLLLRNGTATQWRPMAKDGRTLPVWQTGLTEARQPVNIGETYDFHVQMPDTGAVALEIRRPNGTVLVRQGLRFDRR